MSICLSSGSDFVSAKVYDQDFNFVGDYDLTNVTLGIYKAEASLSSGLFYIYYYFWIDSLKTIPSTSYLPTEEVIRVIDDVEIKINELHKINGLDSSNPMTVTESSRVAGSITQNFTGDGISTTTVTRV